MISTQGDLWDALPPLTRGRPEHLILADELAAEFALALGLDDGGKARIRAGLGADVIRLQGCTTSRADYDAAKATAIELATAAGLPPAEAIGHVVNVLRAAHEPLTGDELRPLQPRRNE